MLIAANKPYACLRYALNRRPGPVKRPSGSLPGSCSSSPMGPLHYIDIGANLTDSMYQGQYNGKSYHQPDLSRVLMRAWASGVQKIIITAGSLSEARRALQLAQTDKRLFCTVGVHPTRCCELDAHPEGREAYIEQLKQVLHQGKQHGKVVAIGECGLDYDRLHFCDRDAQRRGFEAHFDLAKSTGLPMFLHMRAAADDFMSVLRVHSKDFTGGVVHSFTGTKGEVKSLLSLHPALYIGINGCSLKTEENLEAMAEVPLNRMMVETDSPWCECRPTHASARYIQKRLESKDRKRHSDQCLVKGRNEPCSIGQVVEAIAGYRSIQDVASVADTLFGVTEEFFFRTVPFQRG